LLKTGSRPILLLAMLNALNVTAVTAISITRHRRNTSQGVTISYAGRCHMHVLAFKQDTPETKEQLAAISVKNVLYATDFSTTSEAALPYATAICRKFGSTLHVVHVISDTGLLLMTGGVDYVTFGTLYEDANTTAKEKIDAIITRGSGIPWRSYLRHGKVWPNLRSIIAENEIDLIVVGTRGRIGFEKLLLGSVAEDILRHAPCPVLTVGPRTTGRVRLPQFEGKAKALAPVELELQHILYAANLTAASLKVAPFAIAMAEEFGARLTLMHVLESSSTCDSSPSQTEECTRRLQGMVPKDATLAYAPATVIEYGSAWQAIVTTAAVRDADLIVLGAQPSDGTTHLPWSTVHQVVAHAKCPVLTLRSQG
jgi:nucleotide-binding universal stress UspA family protein